MLHVIYTLYYGMFRLQVMHRPNFALRGIENQITSEIEAMRIAAEHSKALQEDFYILELLNTAEEGEYARARALGYGNMRYNRNYWVLHYTNVYLQLRSLCYMEPSQCQRYRL